MWQDTPQRLQMRSNVADGFPSLSWWDPRPVWVRQERHFIMVFCPTNKEARYLVSTGRSQIRTQKQSRWNLKWSSSVSSFHLHLCLFWWKRRGAGNRKDGVKRITEQPPPSPYPDTTTTTTTSSCLWSLTQWGHSLRSRGWIFSFCPSVHLPRSLCILLWERGNWVKWRGTAEKWVSSAWHMCVSMCDVRERGAEINHKSKQEKRI